MLNILRTICPMTFSKLRDYLASLLTDVFHYDVDMKKEKEKSYIYAKGELPVCLVAHLDTVHHKTVETINLKDDIMSSPEGIGGDDRCGVATIIKALENGYRPHVLFTCGEETGGYGARAFTIDYKTLEGVNWFVEIDRKGRDDVVCYQDDNDQLTKIFEKFDFKKNWGTFTDISILCPHFGVSGVNISSGYYFPHQTKEEIHLKDLDVVFGRLTSILESNYVKEKIKYVKRNYSTSAQSYLGKPINYNQDVIKRYPYGEQHVRLSSCVNCGVRGIKDNKSLFDTDYGALCPTCLNRYISRGWLYKCPDCGDILSDSYFTTKELEDDTIDCPFCGCTIDRKTKEKADKSFVNLQNIFNY